MFSNWKLSFQVSSVLFTFIFACLLRRVLFFLQKLNQQIFFFVNTFPFFFSCTLTFLRFQRWIPSLRTWIPTRKKKPKQQHEVGQWNATITTCSEKKHRRVKRKTGYQESEAAAAAAGISENTGGIFLVEHSESLLSQMLLVRIQFYTMVYLLPTSGHLIGPVDHMVRQTTSKVLLCPLCKWFLQVLSSRSHWLSAQCILSRKSLWSCFCSFLLSQLTETFSLAK